MNANVQYLIALSDERDLWERRIEQAYRDGYRAAEIDHSEDYQKGVVDGALLRKRYQHDIVEAAEVDALRWGPEGREHYGDPRPGDFTGYGVDYLDQMHARAAAEVNTCPGYGPLHYPDTCPNIPARPARSNVVPMRRRSA